MSINTLVRRALYATLFFLTDTAQAELPSVAAIDQKVHAAMHSTQSNGLALAVIDQGKVHYVQSYGKRNAAGEALTPNTIMYGASLTKLVVTYTVMQLVAEKKLSLEIPLARYLAKELPLYPSEEKYAPWPDLANDPRWRSISAKTALTHSTGFANFAFLEPDGKLRMHFDPNSRYAYSGEGFILLQFVLERGLGMELGAEMKKRVFDRFGMRNTSMIWRPEFANNLADGWRADGSIEPHDERSKVRAAGSMDTTISDIAQFAAGYIRGAGVPKALHQTMYAPHLAIRTQSQFPSLQPELSEPVYPGLAAGLGMISFEGPQGRGLMKGGHNDSTGNILVCLHKAQRCVVILSNDVRSEAAFPALVDFILGETGAAWRWEYGDMAFWNGR